MEDVVVHEVQGGILDGGQDLVPLPDEEIVDRCVQDSREGRALRTARRSIVEGYSAVLLGLDEGSGVWGARGRGGERQGGRRTHGLQPPLM